MENILILNDSILNNWRFAKFVAKLNYQLKGDIIIYNTTNLPELPVPVLCADELAPAIDDDAFDESNRLSEKLHRCIDHQSRRQASVIQKSNNDFTLDDLGGIVASNHVKMIIMAQQTHDVNGHQSAAVIRLANKLTCPILLVPDTAFTYPDKISYLTDLRYCTKEAVKFLKIFNGSIYVTHITAPGLTDMQDKYSQELLESFSGKLNYNKIFLRNIKGNQQKKSLEQIASATEINCIAVESKKHAMLERFLPSTAEAKRNYHTLPLLILPYLNWAA